MAHGTSERAGWWRRVQRPRVSVVLLALMVLDAFLLAPGDDYATSGSTVANAIGSLWEPRLRGDQPPAGRPAARLGWFEASDEVRVRGEDEKDWAIGYNVYSSLSSEYSGWWGLTRETRGFVFMFDSLVNSATPVRGVQPAGLEERAYAAFAEHVGRTGDPYWANEVALARAAPGGTFYQETRVRWEGWARNGASVALGACFLFSMWWVVREGRVRQRWRRAGRGECAWCRYRVTGLPGGAACPECGRSPAPPGTSLPAPDLLARALRRVRTPWGTAALVAILVVDAIMLPRGEQGNGSRVGNVLPWPGVRLERGDGRPRDQMSVIATLRGEALDFHVVETLPQAEWTHGGPSASEPVAARTMDPDARRVHFSLTRDSYSRGTWAPVWAMVYSNYGGLGWEALPEKPRLNFEASMVAWLATHEDPQVRAWVADVERRRIHQGYHYAPLWWGHVHNACAMAVGFMLVCSLGWVWRLRGGRGFTTEGTEGTEERVG